MSGKYEDVRLAYNPMDKDDRRGELLFKVTYQNRPTLKQRTKSDSVFIHFFTGKGGWAGSQAEAELEISDALKDSYSSLWDLNQTSHDSKERKSIFNKMKELSEKQDNPISIRIAELYDRIYYVVHLDAAGRVVATLSAMNSANWEAVSRLPHQSGVGDTRERVMVGPKPGVATPGSQPIEHLELNTLIPRRAGGGGIWYKLGPPFTAQQVDIGTPWPRARTDNKLFNWDIIQLLNLPGTTANDNIFDDIIGTPGVEFEESVRRNLKGELEIYDNGTWKNPGNIRKAPCDAIGAYTRCHDIFHSCLIKGSKDGTPTALLSEACLGIIENITDDLWKTSKDDIKKIDPKSAFMLLKNLGFKGKTNDDRVVCESVDDWLKRVKANELTDDKGNNTKLVLKGAHTIARIQGYCQKPNFTEFLKLVVGYINSNPAILNQGHGSSRTGSLDPKDPFGLLRPRGNKKSGLADFRNAASRSLDGVHLHVAGIMSALGLGHTNGLMGLLSGGGNVPGYLAPSGTAPLKAKVSRFSYKLEEIYKHYLERLTKMNKGLSKATEQRVATVFKNLKEKEDDLIKWVEYIERYQEIIQLNGDNIHKTITETDLKDAYAKYEKNHSKLRKRTINLIDILDTLSNATSDAEGDGGKVNLPSSV